jgi:hypothetical protein
VNNLSALIKIDTGLGGKEEILTVFGRPFSEDLA